MTSTLSWVLIGMSFLSLIGLGFSGLLVSQTQARQQMRALRISDTVAPYRKNLTPGMATFRPAAIGDRSLIDMTAAIFGFDPRKLDQYPVRWWLVLGGTLVVAYVVSGFIVDIMGPLGLASMPVIWVAMCRILFGWVAGRRRTLLIQQFPDALAMIVRSVRVGVPVLGAIASISREAQPPTSLEFTKFANELAVGVPLAEAVTDMAERNDLAEYRFFATAIGLQTQTGGGLSETLENLGELIRKRLALRERGHALSSEARSSCFILGGLPVVMGLGLWALNPGYMSVLFTTNTGRAILGAAVISLALGAATMRTIIQKSLS
jgi:tight adherence protein B